MKAYIPTVTMSMIAAACAPNPKQTTQTASNRNPIRDNIELKSSQKLQDGKSDNSNKNLSR